MTPTDDRLLTPDALRDIAVKYHPDQLYALYLGADVNVNDYHTKRSVDAHYTDIPALLAHIRAQDAELARLREERAPSCQNGCLLMVKCHDVEEYYEDKSDATNT